MRSTFLFMRATAGVLAALCALGGSAGVTNDANAVDSLAPNSSSRLRAQPRQTAAQLAIAVTDADSGSPIASRIRIVGSSWFGNPRVVVTANGRAQLTIDPGSYELIASHGPEWSVVRRRLVLERSEQRLLHVSLHREVSVPAYSACDLHVHSRASADSTLSLTERAASVAAEDLQVAIVTDHNRVSDLSTVPAPIGTLLVPGVEVTTWAPEFGHFNVFPSASAPRYKRSSPDRLIAELRAEGASFVQVNHPRLMRHIGYFELANVTDTPSTAEAMSKGFDGLEVWNGYDLSRADARDAVLDDWLRLLAAGQHIVATGGSDSHDLRRRVVGYPRTYVRVPHADQRDPGTIVAALKLGRAFVSNGPIVEVEIDGKGPGETVVVPRSSSETHVHVRVDAPAWMDLQTLELWLDGKKRVDRPIAPWTATTKSVDAVRAEWNLQLPLSGVHTVIAVVRGRQPMRELFDNQNVLPFAFTNPVWLADR